MDSDESTGSDERELVVFGSTEDVLPALSASSACSKGGGGILAANGRVITLSSFSTTEQEGIVEREQLREMEEGHLIVARPACAMPGAMGDGRTVP